MDQPDGISRRDAVIGVYGSTVGLIGLGLMFGPFVVAKNLLAGRRAGVGNAHGVL